MTLRRQALAILILLLVETGAYAASDAKERARAFVRLPNWTGQWEIVGVTEDESGGIAQSLDDIMKGIRHWGPPPYKPEAQAAFNKFAAELRKRSQADRTAAPPQPVCAWGFPMLMIQTPLMFEILTTPEETAMIFSGREMRHIYTDGRPHTPKEDLWPTFWGDSIGHWEGQTLVIDTIAVNSPPDGKYPAVLYAQGGSGTEFAMVAVFSSEVHFIERIRMTDKDHLEERMTILDPVSFTAPWRISRQYRRVTGMNRMIHEDPCEGEDRNPVVNGHYTIAPPPAPPGSPAPSPAPKSPEGNSK